MQVEGPVVDEETGSQSYTVQKDEGIVRFTVMPQTSSGDRTEWAVEIEGVPGPGIVHEEPWLSPDEARDAALKAAGDMLVLERMQREELERQEYNDAEPDEADALKRCEDETGSIE
jgi:hypothetical protein